MPKNYVPIQQSLQALRYSYPASAELKEWIGDRYIQELKARHPTARGELTIRLGRHEDFGPLVIQEGDWLVQFADSPVFRAFPDSTFRRRFEPSDS